MKRILWALLILVACGKEEKVSPANASTFVRYFNGGNNDVAEAVLETSDKGLLILATTEIKPNELAVPVYKIKLIKTDAAGNQLWQKFYPDFTTTTGSYKAGGIYVLDNGNIAIAGTSIDAAGSSHLLLLTTDASGDNPATKTVTFSEQLEGAAITTNAAGDYMVLGAVPDVGSLKNMYWVRFSASTLDSAWSYPYGAGQVTLSNKAYLDASKDNLFWGGTVARKNTTTTAIRLTEIAITSANEGAIISDPPIGDPSYNFVGSDFCRFGNNWAFVGHTDQKIAEGGTSSAGDFDIMYQMVGSPNGAVLALKTFPIDGIGGGKDGSGQNEVGNSICVTQEGGLLLLGTVNSQGSFGRGGKDYYLIKIDVLGNVAWTKVYGSKFDDNGVQVIQASDGGYIVLGTTTLANLKSIMLMKVAKDGTIQ